MNTGVLRIQATSNPQNVIVSLLEAIPREQIVSISHTKVGRGYDGELFDIIVVYEKV